MTEENVHHNSRCQKEGHSNHLCILTDKFFHIHNAEEYRAMVKDSEFKCEFCGRTARSDNNLCYPIDL
ncbi:MAG: hypothetical protein ACYS0C_01605 [Planctomycetota bacterium]